MFVPIGIKRIYCIFYKNGDICHAYIGCTKKASTTRFTEHFSYAKKYTQSKSKLYQLMKEDRDLSHYYVKVLEVIPPEYNHRARQIESFFLKALSPSLNTRKIK